MKKRIMNGKLYSLEGSTLVVRRENLNGTAGKDYEEIFQTKNGAFFRLHHSWQYGEGTYEVIWRALSHSDVIAYFEKERRDPQILLDLGVSIPEA